MFTITNGTVRVFFIQESKVAIFRGHLQFSRNYRAAGALPQTAEDTIGRNPSVQSIRPTFTMLFSARFRAVVDTQSFLNSKFGMPLVHLKIEKCRLERARPVGGVDLVLTEWTPPRKSTHKMKNQSWVWCFLEVSAADYGAPKTPWGSGSSI